MYWSMHHWAIRDARVVSAIGVGIKGVTSGNRVAPARDTDGMETLSPAAGTARTAGGGLLLRVLGVMGCLAVAAIHIIDQDGLPDTKDPYYIQVLYYALEAAGVAAAALLVSRPARVGWLFTLGVAAGPILGYVLSRGPGLPNYTDDIGNWSEPLGSSVSPSRASCSSWPQRPCSHHAARLTKGSGPALESAATPLAE
jgi:hypothetical protein